MSCIDQAQWTVVCNQGRYMRYWFLLEMSVTLPVLRIHFHNPGIWQWTPDTPPAFYRCFSSVWWLF